ncbi:hypothetical protein BLS_001799 [Venturia inaequalis]|uniref:Conserved oligomeric Golgi complex subunit 5 n=1 Tax=Venturia inaequalis TaxID=5025 RepID=A0A8H3UUJ5_VENIN|nr:hypothetical protein BLS_001799 [Venturia inaequalis]KAE9978392.1 hypothetical protein EG328_001473 [Venturia inaequalis]KAE9979623.1 hypothetical protein EG327_006941 [Venturia inaequalis]
MTEEEPSYIDYEAFLDPDFSPTAFANTLVLATNNASDTPLDLSTPLSRVLFDIQEIDTHIDSLTTKSALPLLDYTKRRADASGRILDDVESQLASLSDGYKTLEKEVIQRHEAAEEVRLAAERLCETVRLGRAVGRCLMLGRQLEAQMVEFSGTMSKKGDHRAMVRSANTILTVRHLLYASKPGEEGHGLERVNVITSLKSDLLAPSERTLITRAQQTIREFSMSSLLSSNTQNQTSKGPSPASTYAQSEETKSRTISALTTLYLLSPTTQKTTSSAFDPTLLITSLQDYLQTALKSSAASMTRSLATLPNLEGTLLEVSSRCQNILALEKLLENIKPPAHPLFSSTTTTTNSPRNFLRPLLQSLDTSSLPSYFWRTLASSLSPKVQEIMRGGGVSARTLRSNRDRVGEALRACVDRGSRVPGRMGPGRREEKVAGWEREASVMINAVVGQLR